METKKYHRRYPDSQWDYKAISTKIGNKEIIYYTLTDKGKKSSGVEIYSGSNYDVNSKAKSYSKSYSMEKLPAMYKLIVDELIKVHKKTKWSKANKVNFN